MPIRETMITIEGIDKCGKDTVRDLIVKKTEGKVLVMVRTYLSQIVYPRINNKKINEIFFINRLIFDYETGHHHFFVLTASKEVIKKRCIEHNEKDISIDDIETHKKHFSDLIEELGIYVKIHVIDTSSDKPEETADKIIDIVQKVQRGILI